MPGQCSNPTPQTRRGTEHETDSERGSSYEITVLKAKISDVSRNSNDLAAAVSNKPASLGQGTSSYAVHTQPKASKQPWWAFRSSEGSRSSTVHR